MNKNLFPCTWTLTEENYEKILANLEKVRKVDRHITRIIFTKFYQNQAVEIDNLSELCGQFSADIWNAGAVE